jgi:hypothetical protein
MKLNVLHINSGISNTPFHKHQESTTIHQYIVPPLCELGLLLKKSDVYHIPIPEDLNRDIEELWMHLPPQEPGDGLVELHKVFKGLFMRKWTSTEDNPMPCPTIRTLTLLSLQRDGSFAEPKNITGLIAKLERAIQLTCLWELKCLSRSQYGGDDNLACDAIQHWFIEKVESPYSSLRSLQHRASAIAYATTGLPRIWWTDQKEWSSMLYTGTPIHLNQLKTIFVNMEKAVVNVWEEKVLRGLKIQIKYGHLTENLTNKQVGYSFLTDPCNPWFKDRDQLLGAILADPQQRDHFALMDECTGTLIWKTAALRRWLMDYAEFQGVQLARVEMLSGGPSRGTELTAMNYCTTPTRGRNLHVLGNHLAILREYHKSGALCGVDKLIPHGLDAVTMDLMIQDLAIARPFAEIAIHLCFPDQVDIQLLYRHRLFIGYAKEFTTDNLSGIMSKFSIPVLGMKMGVNAYRHIHTGWRRKLCGEALELLDGDEFNTIGALQAGHQRSTENRIYGRSPDALAGSEDILPLYLEASTRWQVLMEVVPGEVSNDS